MGVLDGDSLGYSPEILSFPSPSVAEVCPSDIPTAETNVRLGDDTATLDVTDLPYALNAPDRPKQKGGVSMITLAGGGVDMLCDGRREHDPGGGITRRAEGSRTSNGGVMGVGNYRNLFHIAFQQAAACSPRVAAWETAWCERPSAAASSPPHLAPNPAPQVRRTFRVRATWALRLGPVSASGGHPTAVATAVSRWASVGHLRDAAVQAGNAWRCASTNSVPPRIRSLMGVASFVSW